MADNAPSPPILKVRGLTVAQAAVPRVLQTSLRDAAAGSEDPFLPRGYLRAVAAVDLSATARSATGAAEAALARRDGEVIALELEGGLTVFTTQDRLRETVARVRPAAIDASGAIDLAAFEAAVAGRSRGVIDAGARWILRITSLDVGAVPDAIIDAARGKALEWLKEKGQDNVAELAELGVSWLGTKALMWAIENQLSRKPGLYRWAPGSGEPADLQEIDQTRLEQDTQAGSFLVFVHGTASSTLGSFSELQTASRDYWRQIERRFGDRILAFEHRTFSESPIENALQLARALPAGARLNVVTHSRGGLVGDLLCLDKLAGQDQALIDAFAVDDVALAGAEGPERARLQRELEQNYAEQRALLRELAATLTRKQLTVERYVRVASPARGTRLLSENLDAFLSTLLSVIGLVPALAGNPLYSAVKRIVLEIAKNRTRPSLVPGIEAMLPESPMGRFLARATPQAGTRMAVVAGDIEGGGLLKRIGVFFTDTVLFDSVDNDLVVDTDSMYAGTARADHAVGLFDQGPDVSHFRYFINAETRSALRQWLVEPNLETVEAFRPLPALGVDPSGGGGLGQRAATRGGGDVNLPVVVVVPDFMGSHLWRDGRTRVWLDFDTLLRDGVDALALDKPGVQAEALVGQFYGPLCTHLRETHRVEPFPYDWRQPLDVLGAALAERLRALAEETKASGRPLRILAHGMGGLVVRAAASLQRQLWDEVMSRSGARLVLLGTPNAGSYAMVELLLGRSDLVRQLARVDPTRSLGHVVDVFASFPGALQLLPKSSKDGDGYYGSKIWEDSKRSVRDRWLGDGTSAVPKPQALTAGQWLWKQTDADALPESHKDEVFYVHGTAPLTPDGVVIDDAGQLKMRGTSSGDGVVTWGSAPLGGIGTYLWMPVEHGALTGSAEHFDSLSSLLARGRDALQAEVAAGHLSTSRPETRGAGPADGVEYDVSAPMFPSALDLASASIGRRPGRPGAPRRRPTLSVCVRAIDVRESRFPVLVGHYEQDPISGPEMLIDREIVEGGLTQRYDLGLYAGPVGTATIVLPPRSEMERARGSGRGAVVAGLGRYDGTLNAAALTTAIRTAALRYLLHTLDAGYLVTEENAELSLASLLIGYSSTTLSIGDALKAIVKGVAEANHRFAEVSAGRVGADTGGQILRIGRLEIIELYLDTAISATYALQAVAKALNGDPSLRCRIEASPTLQKGEGVRPRLDDRREGGYWARLMVTDADRNEDDCPPECFIKRCPPECLQEPCDCEKHKGSGDKGAAPDPDDFLVPVPDRRLPPWLRRRLALAERLRFLYLGSSRARAETEVQQRQPGLVERLVAGQLHVPIYQPDFSHTLFQLLVPHDFKDIVRQLERLVLVLDGYTANLPWELVRADSEPLAVTTAMVRQLSSTRFRSRVRQAADRRAYVVGNPSTKGFAAAFPRLGRELASLEAAEREALTATETLARYGYSVTQAIGQENDAVKVVNGLYASPYRVLHVAAHGIFDEPHADGSNRTGVVLSNGLLITAAEIGAMEEVPDLVFLNCCHLGKVDRAPTPLNRLAYSVARELIEIGVRAVVVAGWAVEDEAASLFAQVFYQSMLGERKTFGDSVMDARRAAWARFSSGITWGAYQAYGDPGWRLEARRDEGRDTRRGRERRPVAPDETVARLDQIRLDVARAEHAPTDGEKKETARRVDDVLASLPDESWLKLPEVCTALGRVYSELAGSEYFARAAQYFEQAIQAEAKWKSPVRAIEKLANLEARMGEDRNDPALIGRAIARLKDLVASCDHEPGGPPQTSPGPESANGERAALLGSAYKRLAAVHARRLLRVRGDSAPDAAGMNEALGAAREWYFRNVGSIDAVDVKPYHALNWLFLAALEGETPDKGRRIDLARRCTVAARKEFATEPSYFSAMMPADAVLVEALLDGSLAGLRAADRREQIFAAFDDARRGVRATERQVDSTVKQICLMALFYRASAVGDADHSRVAEALEGLAERLRPGACRDRASEPGPGSPGPGPSETPPGLPPLQTTPPGDGEPEPKKSSRGKGRSGRARGR